MKLLALIPARGGSKRIPNKNIRTLGNKPLIAWTIEATRGIPEIVDVLVSTDNPVIAQAAVTAGALVPWLRPDELATDTATTVAVCIHALEWYERNKGSVDGLLLLQPTSPFRSTYNIQRGVELFKKHPQRSVVSLSPATSHPMWCYRIDNNRISSFMGITDKSHRSQDLPPAYVVNGALYIAGSSYLRENHGFIGSDTLPLLIDDTEEALDIDTEDDWLMAETILSKRLL